MASGPRKMVFSTLAKTESTRKDNVTMSASVHISVTLEHNEEHSSIKSSKPSSVGLASIHEALSVCC